MIITTAYCAIYKIYPKWQTIIIPIIVNSIILILIIELTKEFNTWSIERLGGWATAAVEYEEWDEWITSTCTREIPDGVDINGKPKTKTEEYDCSYREYHPPYWEVHTSNSDIISISKEEFYNLTHKFGNITKIDMHRDYYTIDGDKNVTYWNNLDKTLQPVFTTNTYRNKVKASHSAFEYITIRNHKHLYDYPRLHNYLYDPAILGSDKQLLEADKLLQFYNAKYGRSKQVRIWILLFRNTPRTTGYEQESYWKGGEKNEIVVCIGINPNGQWCHVFCWSPDGNSTNDIMKIKIRDYVENNDWDLIKTTNYITTEVTNKFVRKPFIEFEYLTIYVPTWVFILIYIIATISSIINIIIITNNQHQTCQK